jgi:hypothetical protein
MLKNSEEGKNVYERPYLRPLNNKEKVKSFVSNKIIQMARPLIAKAQVA